MGNVLCRRRAIGVRHNSDSAPPNHPPSSTAYSAASTTVGSTQSQAAAHRPRMPPTMEHKRAAEQAKSDGNVLFQRGKFAAAIDKYTEGITLCPDWPVLYVNRAMCHKKKAEWSRVVEDSQHALQLDKDLMKAHYLLGLAFAHLKQYPAAITHLQKALEAAREQNANIKDEIWHELGRANYEHWQEESAKRKAEISVLKEELKGLLKQKIASAGMNQLPVAWEQLFKIASVQDNATEAPSMFTCPLTMEIFRDPVVTPSGRSYEKAALLEHLTKVGNFDPITRQAMTQAEVFPNLSLRTAIQNYLDEHPWAWGEV